MENKAKLATCDNQPKQWSNMYGSMYGNSEKELDTLTTGNPNGQPGLTCLTNQLISSSSSSLATGIGWPSCQVFYRDVPHPHRPRVHRGCRCPCLSFLENSLVHLLRSIYSHTKIRGEADYLIAYPENHSNGFQSCSLISNFAPRHCICQEPCFCGEYCNYLRVQE